MYIVSLKKYFAVFVIIFSLSLSGCFFIPCKTTLFIENLSNGTKIILIDREMIINKNNIQNGETLFFDNRVMKNIIYVYIKNESIEGIFELREYDHWFASNHNVRIIIKNDYFEIESGGLRIIEETSYKWKNENIIHRWDEASGKIIEENIDPETIFEIIKKERYKDIYDIIKKTKNGS
jgi:hypothetical protein